MWADLLKFGDVILSSGYEFKDYGVVMATRRGNPARRYSHAALMINPAVWLESTGEGTGLTHFRVMKCGEMGAPAQPPDLQRLSKQNIVATLRLRIKTLEEKNRELSGLLELV